MTPIEKNIVVVDEQGNILEATYPKRASGLVKKGRARFISENMICLACPPEKMEENKMSNTQNKFENLEILIDKYVGEHTTESTLKEDLLSAIEDEKFLQAVKISLENNKASTALIQKKLKLGFSRAANIIDAMEALGLLSAPNKKCCRQLFPEAIVEYLAWKSR
ncbi:MAG: hypothetical protein IKB51_04685 [Clostridia bacterium]|nr:hypothetical protein [Clostridia bacterium]